MARTDSRRLVTVVPFNGSLIKYGFNTNLDASRGRELGHTDVTSTTQGFVFGANSPKPAKARKSYAAGIASSYVNAGSIASARTAGWKIGKAKSRGGGSTARAKVVYVTVNGVKYAWSLPNDTAQRIGNISSLGIKIAQTNEKNLVFGATRPIPPQARKVTGAGGSQTIISTYYDPTITLPGGWTKFGDTDPERGE